MKIKAVMFDLDGTLSDTLRDIAEAGNHMLRQMGRDPLPVDRYRYLAGQGLPWLVEHALESDAPETFEKGIAHYRRYYEAHRYDHTDLYPGVPEMLDGLVEAGLTIAVLSNKPHDATLEMVHRLMKKWPFAIVQGHEEGGPLKPDPAAAKRIAEGLEIPLEHWAYVGDTKVDTTTAVNAGMFGVGVTWGFREESELREHGADAIIHHPAELLDAIEAAEPAK